MVLTAAVSTASGLYNAYWHAIHENVFEQKLARGEEMK